MECCCSLVIYAISLMCLKCVFAVISWENCLVFASTLLLHCLYPALPLFPGSRYDLGMTGFGIFLINLKKAFDEEG